MSKEKIIKFIKETSDPIWIDDTQILKNGDVIDIIDEYAKSQLTQANAKIEELEWENENLKCCGNCKLYFEECPYRMKMRGGNTNRQYPFKVCNAWTSDNLTNKERKQ